MRCGVARRRRAWPGALAVVLALAAGAPGAAAGDAVPTGAPRPSPAPLVVGERERLLVVAPHPDDEVLGAGGLIQRVLARGGTVDVLLVTAGDGYPEAVRGDSGLASPAASDFVAYGARRIAETRAALDVLGGSPGRVRMIVLGFPDGSLPALRGAHWSPTSPARSPTTGATDPPYDGQVADDAAPYAGEALLAATTEVVRRVRPTLVALPDPLDVHGDHATAGWFALAALADARADARIAAFLVHWPSWPPGWDAASVGAEPPGGGLDLPSDLPPRGGGVALALTPGELDVKRRALARHATQQRQMAVYLDAFVRGREPYTRLGTEDAAHARTALRAAPAAP